VYSTFEPIIIGEKLTVMARDLVHLLGCSDTITGCYPQTPNNQNNDSPSNYKAHRDEKGLYSLDQQRYKF
jgi:hypothetical protein